MAEGDTNQKPNLKVTDFTPTGESTAGKSKSFQAMKSDEMFQVKHSNSTKASRKVIGYDTNCADILGEFVASVVAKNILGNERSPEVFLVEGINGKLMLASRYFKNCKNLDEYLGAEKDKHVHIDFLSDQLTHELKKELINNLYASLLLRNHDPNTANQIVLLDDNMVANGVAQADYGHSFDDLVKHWGLKNKESANETILGYLNRSELNGNRESKFRRDYSGVMLNKDFIKQLELSEEILSKIQMGIGNAFAEIHNFSENCKDQNIKNELLKSMKTLSLRTRTEMDKKEVIDNASEINQLHPILQQNLTQYLNENVIEAKSVGNMLRVQKMVEDAFTKGEEIKFDDVNKIWSKDDKYLGGEGFNKKVAWARLDDQKSEFKGNLEEYIAERSEQLKISPRAIITKLNAYQGSNSPAIDSAGSKTLANRPDLSPAKSVRSYQRSRINSISNEILGGK